MKSRWIKDNYDDDPKPKGSSVVVVEPEEGIGNLGIVSTDKY